MILQPSPELNRKADFFRAFFVPCGKAGTGDFRKDSVSWQRRKKAGPSVHARPGQRFHAGTYRRAHYAKQFC